MTKKVKAEKISEMDQKTKYAVFANQLGGTIQYYFGRIKFTFKLIRTSAAGIREAFNSAMEDGKIDDNEASEIVIKTILTYQRCVVANIYLRRVIRVNAFVQKLSKKVPSLNDVYTKNQ